MLLCYVFQVGSCVTTYVAITQPLKALFALAYAVTKKDSLQLVLLLAVSSNPERCIQDHNEVVGFLVDDN